ncbi:MAG: hypothetical protein AAGC60_18705 [Acidobacteriota bacterium]
MKAIVLTYDKYRLLAEHMVARYDALWPEHPFTWHVPYQQDTEFDGRRVELVQTPPAIKDTVLTLLRDLPDDEWIYWALDDKYPLFLDVEPIDRLSRWIAAGEAPDDYGGVLFCRCRHMLSRRWARPHRGAQPPGVPLLERNSYQQIWIHQFLRVRVVRHLFGAFPDRIPQANVMDEYKDRMTLPPDHRLFVTRANAASFGESTDAGRLTRNCAESLDRHGFERPPLPASPDRIVLGESSPWAFRATLLARLLPESLWPTMRRMRRTLRQRSGRP